MNPYAPKLTPDQRLEVAQSTLSARELSLIHNISTSRVLALKRAFRARQSVAPVERAAPLHPVDVPCPCCHQLPPTRRAEAKRWVESYGHRCHHGEPCPSHGPAHGDTCAKCMREREAAQ